MTDWATQGNLGGLFVFSLDTSFLSILVFSLGSETAQVAVPGCKPGALTGVVGSSPTRSMSPIQEVLMSHHDPSSSP